MEKLISQLRTILGTKFALYFKAHSYHWNVEGPDFPEYHGFLGDFYDYVLVVEIDENQHQGYSCENKRMMEIFVSCNNSWQPE